MAKNNVWMSFSDLMTGLMIIFLFVAIAYISRVKRNHSVLTDYVDVKAKFHEKLVKEFEGDTAVWQMSIGKDLSMKFTNPEVLFASGRAELTPQFKSILDAFIPKYLNILINDSLKKDIKEIRIEGHTDNVPAPQYHSDPYLGNVKLSQARAFAVLEYIRNMESFKSYTEEEKKLLDFWFTANGLSYGKAVDETGEYLFNSNKEIDKDRSRRVEFRIVTTGDEVLENFVKSNKEIL